MPIELTAQERFDYAQAEAVYRDFLDKHRLPMRSPEDWQRFIMVASTSHSGGREALLAARRRREIREGAMRKGATLETLLRQHWQDRCIVFTKSVEEVYALSRRFLLPGITYETPAKERKEILDRFREGRYRAIIASDVLNEGVDVPDANVAIIDRKSTRLNSSHANISYAVFCLKKKNHQPRLGGREAHVAGHVQASMPTLLEDAEGSHVRLLGLRWAWGFMSRAVGGALCNLDGV